MIKKQSTLILQHVTRNIIYFAKLVYIVGEHLQTQQQKLIKMELYLDSEVINCFGRLSKLGCHDLRLLVSALNSELRSTRKLKLGGREKNALLTF